jgi:hypothetical protein
MKAQYYIIALVAAVVAYYLFFKEDEPVVKIPPSTADIKGGFDVAQLPKTRGLIPSANLVPLDFNQRFKFQ